MCKSNLANDIPCPHISGKMFCFEFLYFDQKLQQKILWTIGPFKYILWSIFANGMSNLHDILNQGRRNWGGRGGIRHPTFWLKKGKRKKEEKIRKEEKRRRRKKTEKREKNIHPRLAIDIISDRRSSIFGKFKSSNRAYCKNISMAIATSSSKVQVHDHAI